MTLVWLILIPLLGGALSWQSGRWSSVAPRWLALLTLLTGLGLSLWIWLTQDFSLTGAGFAAATDAAPRWTLEYRVNWIPAIGASFHLGLDGLSILMIVLANLLGVLAVASAWRDTDADPGFFYLNLLWNLVGVIGVFLALDLLLFFFFWEMMLVPMYFLITLRGYDPPGGKSRQVAAVKFVIYTQASGLLLLVAILGLVFAHSQSTGLLSFDYHDLLGTPMGSMVEWLLMLGFFIAFAVKMPMVPLHGWLPDAHASTPTSGAADVAGLLLKTGAYGLLRFGIPLFPNASLEIAPFAMWMGVVGVVYGAVVAFSQHDIKRLIAYAGISHMGFVLIGIYAGTEQALMGVVVQMIAHGLSAAALFILCGEIHERYGTRDMRQLGGLSTQLPNLPRLFMFFALATLGLPGLGNFVGEFLILSGAFSVAPLITITASVGLILSVLYSLIMVQRTLHGPVSVGTNNPSPNNPSHSPMDLSWRELTIVVSLLILLVGLGLYPQPVIDTASASMRAFEALYTAGVAP